MGLDMYLTKKVYVGAEYEHRKVTGVIDIKVGDKPLAINFSNVSYIEERAGYWRKANAIHKWFVENVQEGTDDCGNYEVSTEQLQQLLDVVSKVLEASELVEGKVINGQTGTAEGWVDNIEDGKVIKDSSVAEELLPCSSGFFFGSTQYDEYYHGDLVATKEILEAALAGNPGDYEFYYHSSW